MGSSLPWSCAVLLAAALAAAPAVGQHQPQRRSAPPLPSVRDVLWDEAVAALHRQDLHFTRPGRVIQPQLGQGRRRATEAAAMAVLEDAAAPQVVVGALHLLVAVGVEGRAPGAAPSEDPRLPHYRRQLGHSDPTVVIAALRGILTSPDPEAARLVEFLAGDATEAGVGELPNREATAVLLAAARAQTARAPLSTLVALLQANGGPTDRDFASHATIPLVRWLARVDADPRGQPFGNTSAGFDADPAADAGQWRRHLTAALVGLVITDEADPWVRVHGSAAIAELLGPGGSDLHQQTKLDLGRALTDELPPAVRAGIVHALGRLALDPTHFGPDRRLESTFQRELLRSELPDKHDPTPLAIGRMGGRRSRLRLISRLSSVDGDEAAWYLLGLGVLAHHQRLVDAPFDNLLVARIRGAAEDHASKRQSASHLAARLGLGLAGNKRQRGDLRRGALAGVAIDAIAWSLLLPNSDAVDSEQLAARDRVTQALLHTLDTATEPDDLRLTATALAAVKDPQFAAHIGARLRRGNLAADGGLCLVDALGAMAQGRLPPPTEPEDAAESIAEVLLDTFRNADHPDAVRLEAALHLARQIAGDAPAPPSATAAWWRHGGA